MDHPLLSNSLKKDPTASEPSPEAQAGAEELKWELSEKEATIEKQNSTIAEQDEELDRVKSDVEKLRSEIRELKRQAETKKKEVMKGQMPPSRLSSRQHQGYLGLQLSRDPPHAVEEVHDLTDEKGVVQGSPGYANEPVQRGDILLSVDGKDTTQMSLDGIHGLLKGDLLTTVQLSFGRGGGRVYVKAMRHRFHQKPEAKPMQNETEGLGTEVEELKEELRSRDEAIQRCTQLLLQIQKV